MDFYKGNLVSAEVPPSAYISSQEANDDTTSSNRSFLNVLRSELSDEVFKDSLAFRKKALPEPTDSDESRKKWVQSLVHDFFVSTPEDKVLYEKIDSAIKLGYSQRMPSQVSDRQQKNLLISLSGADTVWSEVSEEAHRNNCILLYGSPGSGKSMAVNRCLNLYPQVVWHESIGQCQLTYLKIDLARASSVIEYCHRFLESLSAALGSAKYQQEVVVPRNENAALLKIETLMHTYNVGIISIDSLDHILTWKLGYQQRILTHFYALGACVSIIYTARTQILHAPVIVASRLFPSLSIGSIYWDPLAILSGDEKEIRQRWHFFTKKIWKHHCLQQHDPEVSPELHQFWFDASRGIIKYAVLLFVHSHIEAIRSGEERISVEIMREVAAKELAIFKTDLMHSSNNEMQILSENGTAEINEQSQAIALSSKRAKKKKKESAENMMPEGFKKVPRKEWLSLPEDDLRHIYAAQNGKNMYEVLKLKKLVLTNGELFGSVQFPKTIQG